LNLILTSLEGIPEVQPGDDLAGMLLEAAADLLEPGDLLVVTHKVVSKAEGRLVALDTIQPSDLALRFARRWGKDPRAVELVLRESREVVRMARGVIISRTRHGQVCANAGVDLSNAGGGQVACLLPLDPDASARGLAERIQAAVGFAVPVVVCDSFGRAWREGIVNVALGVAGMDPFTDYRGTRDPYGYDLRVSRMASADALAAAAELAMGKVDGVPAVLVRGFPWRPGEAGGVALVRPPENDLFP
jgi:coenzyme F420-0:L-glutamate ligase/coenzyme F420-1:gamma-L-glutamate ligase